MPQDPNADWWPEEVQVTRQQIQERVHSAQRGRRRQKSFYLSEEVIERMSAAVFWAQTYALRRSLDDGTEVDMSEVPDSLSALVETGIWAEVLRIEKALNGGEPFPPPVTNLRPGPKRRGMDRLAEPRGPRRRPADDQKATDDAKDDAEK